ncbi:MAG TPA: UbiA family prenyltransferase [Candidatus Acidoferrum sp.]
MRIATSLLALLTLGWYLFFYTPLKRRTLMCTFVGAFSGAMPVLIGYVAATGKPIPVTRARRHGHSIVVANAQIAAIAASCRLSVATRDETPFRAASITVINPWVGMPMSD